MKPRRQLQIRIAPWKNTITAFKPKIKFIFQDVKNEDFIICEIGGTVGDIESLPFLEAIRQFSN